MGYYMEQEDSSVVIKKENFEKALQAIKELKGKETILDSSGSHFSWVDNNFVLKETLEEALECWRWKAIFDKNGDIENLEFTGEKFGDDKELFDAISPYVEKGSYINMIGESDSGWCWNFDGKLCIEIPRNIFRNIL